MPLDIVPDQKLETVEEWFRKTGGTDESYLRAHFRRFVATHEFAMRVLPPQGTMLDIGCHWLHQAIFFADEGYKIIGADAPNTLDLPSVKKAAALMGASLIPYRRLDKGEGILDIATDSVDAVMFSEIIEHLAFNPIPMWKEIYRVMKPGAHIIITTPNSMYHESLARRMTALLSNAEYGININEIFSTGTYGHHWKEFSIPELRRYFQFLSSDFAIGEVESISCARSVEDEKWRLNETIEQSGAGRSAVDFSALIDQVYKIGGQPLGSQILLDVSLPKKLDGIQVSPPWLIE